MNRKELVFLLLFTVSTICIFFAKTIFLRQIPFPGDLLIDTTPFKSVSFFGFAPGGYPNKAQGRDVITQSYPWKVFSISQLKKGQLPLWNPYNFSGNPHIANYQTGIFYPLNIVFFIFPFVLAWALFIILQPVLSLIFMYIYLKSLKISSIPSFLGGVAFAFSSYMVVWLEYGNIVHTLLWLPLMLFAVKRFIEKRTMRFACLFVIAGACCLLAGYIQGAFYAYLVTALCSFCLISQKKDKKLWLLVPLVFIISVAVSAVQIAPTISLFISSTRGMYTSPQIQNLLNPFYYLITLFGSEFFGNPATRNFYLPITYFERVMYVGIPFLFFAVYAVQKVRNFEVKFFGILAVIVLLLTTNIPGVSWLYSLPIPVLSTTVPTRFLSIFAFSAVVIGAIGIDFWLRKKDIKSWAPYIFGGIYVVIWIGLLTAGKLYPDWQPNISVSKHTFILSTTIAIATIFVFFLRYKFKQISLILLGIIIVADLFYVFTKFTPFSPTTFMYPKTNVVTYLQEHEGIYRDWGYGNAYIPANYATEFCIYEPDGYDALHNKDYNMLLNSSAEGKILLPLSRGDANVAPGSGFARVPDNKYRQQILDLLGVKYIIHTPFSGEVNKAETGVLPEDFYKMVWHDDSYQIYENLHVFPRFFLANSYKIVYTKNEIKEIYNTDLRQTVLLYDKPSLSLGEKTSGTVVLKSYQPNEIVFQTNTQSPQLLFLSDTYDSGWQATIDGKVTKVFKADIAFRAVEVPKGQHTIVMSYQPRSFKIGLIISLVTLGLAGILGVFVISKKK